MPSEDLIVPKGAVKSSNSWNVVARTRRVNKRWEKIIATSADNAVRCYEWLCEKPMQRWPGRVFPLRGKKYKGAWEFEVTGGDRLYYIPDPKQRRVVVYYAGPHPNPPAPTPP